ncbi:MAG: cobalamin-binding protein [candidate division WOR-3 bacterium]|jgi:iron complex transport system substrate-binding protein
MSAMLPVLKPDKIILHLAIMTLVTTSCGSKKPLEQRLDRGLSCVSLVPSITEIIYALDGGGLLKGNTNQCDYPAAARQVYKVGDFQAPDLERIIAVKPAVVFATLPVHARLIERLREMKVRVYVSEPKSIADVFAEIESVGAILGMELKARWLADSLRQCLSMLPNFTDTPRVYIEIASAPLMSVGRRTFLNDLIKLAGGKNIFEFIEQPYPVVAPEDVARKDPEVILIMHPGTSRIEVQQRVGWQTISAIRSGRVYDGLDESLFFRPGPRVIEAVFLLARLLHQNRVH